MTRTGRALLGAMLGAALTLLLHPASRPYLFSVFNTPSTTVSAAQTKIPTELVELSDWMSAIGDRYSTRNPPTKIELENGILAAEQAARLDPDNAFWRQMLASLHYQLGHEEEAKRQWVLASKYTRWNDYQTTELLNERERLARDFGADQSWQLAYVYYQRNGSAVAMIASYGRMLLKKSPLDTDEGLLLRAANVINGSLLRHGCQSIQIGSFGAEMAETACHPPEITANLNHHRLFVARVTMQDRLRALGQNDLAEQVSHVYREADGWDAFVDAHVAKTTAAQLSVLSVVYVGLPGMLIPLVLVGAALWLVGHSVRRLDRIHLAPAAVIGSLLGLGVYLITYLPLAAIASFLCCVFLTLGPKRERANVSDLGPMFGFTAGTLGMAFMLLVGSFIIGLGSPAVSILPYLDVPGEYVGGSGVLLGLAIIVLAIFLLLAPLFAIALRVGTSFVLSSGLKKLGSFLALTALAFIVLGTPLCIYLDRQNGDALRSIVVNEPVYYLTLAQ